MKVIERKRRSHRVIGHSIQQPREVRRSQSAFQDLAAAGPSSGRYRGRFAAYQWRREARIAAWIAFATLSSYAEHLLRYELLTWLDRGAAVSLAIVLVRRVGFIPRRCHLAVAALLWATCDILYGNLSRPLYVSLHTCGQRRNHPVVRASSTLTPRRLWHVSIWTYVAELPQD